MGYTKNGIRHYKWITNSLNQFMYEHGYTKYSRIIGEAFLRDSEKSGLHTNDVLQRRRCVVRRFNCYMEQGKYISRLPRACCEISPHFAEVFNDYIDYQRVRGLKETTIEYYSYNIQKALSKFDVAEIKALSEIRAETIYEVFEKTGDKHGFCPSMRSFLSYLFDVGIVKSDFSAIIPSVRKARPVPSVYTASETEKLLNSTENDIDIRKRNNAIILMALRLGMRTSDIINLKITDVDFTSKTIRFIQEKTRVPQRLELLPEIEEALLSYISTARPDSNILNIFLTTKMPIKEMGRDAVYPIIYHRFKASGIDTGERKRGAHALRMTLASELIAEKVPHEVVRKILGHEDPVSIKHYVIFDIEALRSCAVETPPVMGKLAAYMEARGGVSQ